MFPLMKTKIFLVLLLFSEVFVFSGGQALAEERDHKIRSLRPYRIADYIEFTKGQKRALLIYAAWCPYCRAKIPDLIKMEDMKGGSIIAVSEDQNYAQFSEYISSLSHIPYEVILSNPTGSDTLPKALRQFGVKAWKGYPTIVLFDEDNNVVSQGTLPSDYIKSFLFSDD